MSEWNIRETPLDELDRDAAIRFAAIHGNTIALMDMGRNPKIYLIDLGWYSNLFFSSVNMTYFKYGICKLSKMGMFVMLSTEENSI